MSSELERMASVFPNLTVEDIKQGQIVLTDVIAKYYGDPDFKDRLDADAAAVLNAEGFPIPLGRAVKLVFNDDRVMNIVLPWIAPENPETESQD